MNEVVFLCEIIRLHAEGEPPNCVIKFGKLFVIYNYYSQSVSEGGLAQTMLLFSLLGC